MTHFEVGINNQTLLWQPHFLSKLCERETDSLIDEPTLNPTNAKTPFEIAREKGISWRWSGWQKAKLKLFDADNNIRLKPLDTADADEIRFADCSNAAQIELKLEDAQGNTSAIKMLLPIVMRIGAVEILKDQRKNSVVIRVTGKTKVNDLQIEKLLPRSPFYRNGIFTLPEKEQQISLRLKEVGIRMFEPFFLVVSIPADEGRKILRCVAIDDFGDLIFEDDIPENELKRLRLWTEGTKTAQKRKHQPTFNDWLDNWTKFSRDKFVKLKEMSENDLKIPKDDAENYLQNYPTGLLRCLMLKKLGCDWVTGNLNRSLKTLNQGDFFNAIKTAEPVLSGVLDYLPNNAEIILWAVRNARHPLLVDAVRNTGDRVIKGLERELHLLEMRASGISARNEKQKTKTV